ncbi:RNA polymerase sigma-70 factor [Paraflavitalea soli]|uniref:RNA polymerase sigma-70 factor n=1 Tax=Paraflavitalea soli TaxID=2315862 RepID=A0A3B7MUL5_9BACT|nr:RNA polymerase sigma-70 factor [Paraflavitalea soli]AXY74161.1 RNA polymerase sigma-70 factor [Paraflavitalea soli]
MTTMLPKEQTYGERELFALISRNDEQAFTEIYLRYADKLYLHVTKLLKEDSWAEEIVQDTFVKLWQVRDTLGEVANPSAYLYKIVANRTLDFLKHRAVEVKTQYQVSLSAESAARNDTQEQLDFRISEQLLKQAMKDLTAQKQLIFRLKHEDGHSYEEIARQLNLSKNTVRNHLAEALQTIRTYLLKKGAFLLLLLHCLKNL